MYPNLFDLNVFFVRKYWYIFIIVGIIAVILGYVFYYLKKKRIKKQNKNFKNKILYYLSLCIMYIGIATTIFTLFVYLNRDLKGYPINTIHISTYSLFIGIAFITAIIVIVLKGKRLNIPLNDILTFCIVGLILSFAGAIITDLIGTVIAYAKSIKDWASFADIIRLGLQKSELNSFGALIFTIPFGLIYMKLKGHNVPLLLDSASPVILLGFGIAKWGCFFNGCCFGKVCTKNPIALNVQWFSAESSAFSYYSYRKPYLAIFGNDVYIWSAQIIESLTYLAIFVILQIFYAKLTLKNKAPFYGFIFSLFLIMYGMSRFFIEFIRVNPTRDWLWGLTDAQGTSILLVLFGIGIIIYNMVFKIGRKKDKSFSSEESKYL